MYHFFLLGLFLAVAAASPLGNVVTFGTAKFSFLSSTLVRMQQGEVGTFDERPSLSFPFSTAPVSPIFVTNVTTSGDIITVNTLGVQLTYNQSGSGAFSSTSLSVSLLTPPYSTWTPGTAGETLGGTRLDLGCYDNFVNCYSNGLGWGPLSRVGWALWDDTNSTKMQSSMDPSVGFPWFDVAKPTSSDIWDLFLFAQGLDFKAGLRDFARVSGPPPLPPLSSFGVWWSTWYDFSEGEFDRIILQEYANRNLPLDVAVLDMGWHIQPHKPNCSSWGGFTWNRGLIPSAEAWVKSLRAGSSPTGAPLAVLLNGHPDDGVGPCEENYTAFSRAIGADPSVHAMYPCRMGNATWASALINTMLAPKGLNAWWTDYNGCDPPSRLTLPLPYASGCPTATQSNSSTQELLWSNYVYTESLRVTGARPLVLSRYGGLGNQRMGIGFSGDTQSTWDTLALQVAMTPTAANVLFGYWSHDIGGYNVYCPKNGKITPCTCYTVVQPCNLTTGDHCGMAEPELYTRWLQYGALSPILRTHCSHCDRRIWSYAEPFYSAMAAALRFRRALQPFFYTAAANATTDFALAVHPLYHQFPELQEAYSYAPWEYLLGPGLLVAPVTLQGGLSPTETLWLPPGNWLPWDTGASSSTSLLLGPTTLTLPPAALEEYRVWARGGTVLPTQPSTAGKLGTTLVWVIFSGSEAGGGVVYEDDGVSTSTAFTRTPLTFSFLRGKAARDSSSTTTNTTTLSVSVGPVGGPGYPSAPKSRRHVLQLRGFGGAASSVVCSGQGTLPALQAPTGGAAEAYNQTGWWQVTGEIAQPWMVEGALVVVPDETQATGGLSCDVTW